MNIDYQVIRFNNKIKPKDIGGLGVELDQRKGSGNYDKNRTQFNIEYVGLDNHPTLASKVYQTIYTNNIHFNKGDNTNILNGCIITSGPDFFRKLVHKIEYGKFLNADNFWKQLGGKSSYARIQDEYNEFINSKGFNLDRGNVGSNRHHKDKAEHNIEVLNKQIETLQKEIEYNKSINNIELNTNKEILNLNEEQVLSPSKDIFKKYKDKDVEKLINYSKEIKKENINWKNELDKKNMKIEKLENQISQFKSGKTYSDKDKVIANQERIINEQKGIIDSLTEEIQTLKDKLKSFTEIFWSKINNAYLAIAHLLGFKHVDSYHIDYDLMEDKIDSINRKREYKHEKSTRNKHDDYEL